MSDSASRAALPLVSDKRGRALRDRLGAGEGHVTLTDEAGLVVAVAVLMRKESK